MPYGSDDELFCFTERLEFGTEAAMKSHVHQIAKSPIAAIGTWVIEGQNCLGVFLSPRCMEHKINLHRASLSLPNLHDCTVLTIEIFVARTSQDPPYYDKTHDSLDHKPRLIKTENDTLIKFFNIIFQNMLAETMARSKSIKEQTIADNEH